MKILFIHTYYRQKGGEDAVFEQDCALIGKSSNASSYSFRNKEGIAGAIQFFVSLWNVSAAGKIREVIKKEKPDLIHIHNLHYAAGPIIIRTAKKAGIPVIMTLHNFRLICPSGSLLDDGKLFTDSTTSSFPWKAVRRKVYRRSMIQTFWLAFIIWFHKKMGTWKMCDRYLIQTDFAKEVFINSTLGLPKEKFAVNPNFVNPPHIVPVYKKNHFLFIGRLSAEKGIDVLLNAFTDSGNELHIAGDGPLKEKVETFCNSKTSVKYLGNLTKKDVEAAMQECTALVFPSIWYEGMPMTILEALSLGTPVIASDKGAMSNMIVHNHNGLLFEMGNPEDLASQIRFWNTLSEPEKNNYRNNSQKTFLEKYSPARYSKQLLCIYNEVLDTK